MPIQQAVNMSQHLERLLNDNNFHLRGFFNNLEPVVRWLNTIMKILFLKIGDSYFEVTYLRSRTVLGSINSKCMKLGRMFGTTSCSRSSREFTNNTSKE
ncbi:hypothetical protein RIR_jg31961.t1 [Rhizophagus irregularis DAOM 181602=DAOM 197198]|nr:hypothetical protein RIR_jg31961.t1 [Rhizophagus irregularis DAOM 181602=DAOM 197198]